MRLFTQSGESRSAPGQSASGGRIVRGGSARPAVVLATLFLTTGIAILAGALRSDTDRSGDGARPHARTDARAVGSPGTPPGPPSGPRSGARAGAPGSPSTPPSVLLLTIDTLRPDYLGFYGYDRNTSPVMDSLLAHGWSFDRAYAPIARTTPALASLFTGAYPRTTRVRSLLDRLPDDVTSMTTAFGAAGYRTLAVVTNRVLAHERDLARDFEIYDWAQDARTAKWTTDAALRHLASLGGSSRGAAPAGATSGGASSAGSADGPATPFFAWIHYIDPHVPYHSDPAIIAEFDPGYEGRYAKRFGYQPKPNAPPETIRPFPKNLRKREATHRNPLPEEVNAHIRRLYAADIRATDDELARLLDAYRAAAAGNLLVVFTADHGESLGEHDFYWDHGDYVYDAGTRVPLAFLLPEGHPLQGRGRLAGPVSLVDVAPTLFELLERNDPPVHLEPLTDRWGSQVEGRSLAHLFEATVRPAGTAGTAALETVPVFAESGDSFFPNEIERRVRNDVAGRFRAVVSGDLKLIWTPFQTGALEWELYDLAVDPAETEDRMRPDHPRFPELRDLLFEWIDYGESRPYDRRDPKPISPEDLEVLRSLGYVE